MIFNDYIAAALRTAKPMSHIANGDMRHGVMGLVTEIGEFASEVKRISIYEKLQTTEMTEHMLEELGDAFWYIPVFMRGLGLSSLRSLKPADVDYTVDCAKTLDDIVYATVTMIGALAIGVLDPEFAETRDETEVTLCLIVLLLERACALLGSSGDDVRAANIAKLRLRYPNAYSNEAAEARADKGGAAHTES